MQLNLIIADLLKKYKKITIPGLGTLQYDIPTTTDLLSTSHSKPQLTIDSASSQNDGSLVRVISKVLESDFDQANEEMQKQISQWKETLEKGDEINLPEVGTIRYRNGNLETQTATNIIPSDFFGLGDLDSSDTPEPNSLYDFKELDISPIPDFQQKNSLIPPSDHDQDTEFIVDTEKNTDLSSDIEITDFDSKNELESDPKEDKSNSKETYIVKTSGITTIPILGDELEVTSEETNVSNVDNPDSKSTDHIEAANQSIDDSDHTNIEKRDEDQSIKVEPIDTDSNQPNNYQNEAWVNEVVENELSSQIETESESGHLTNDETQISNEDKTENLSEDELIHNETQTIDETLGSISDNENEHLADLEHSKSSEHSADPKVIKPEIVNDRIRKRISRYDDDDIAYTDDADDMPVSKIWFKRLELLLAALVLAFLIPWIVASMKCKLFLGLKPLWDAGCGTPSIAHNAAKADSVNLDTTQKSINDTTKPKNTADAPKLPSQQTNSIQTATVNNSNSTSNNPNTALANNKNASANNSKSTVQTNNSRSTVQTPSGTSTNSQSTNHISIDSKSGQTANIKSTSKPKANATNNLNTTKSSEPKDKASSSQIKPVSGATSVYRKGNAYLCFGTFKKPEIANSLRSDLSKIGVPTETVYVDGTYRVVIPYLNRSIAEKSAKDFPNTIIFE